LINNKKNGIIYLIAIAMSRTRREGQGSV